MFHITFCWESILNKIFIILESCCNYPFNIYKLNFSFFFTFSKLQYALRIIIATYFRISSFGVISEYNSFSNDRESKKPILKLLDVLHLVLRYPLLLSGHYLTFFVVCMQHGQVMIWTIISCVMHNNALFVKF